MVKLTKFEQTIAGFASTAALIATVVLIGNPILRTIIGHGLSKIWSMLKYLQISMVLLLIIVKKPALLL